MVGIAIRNIVVAGIASMGSIAPAMAEWRATEVEKPYAISGSSGIDLYRAVGNNGPLLGGGTRTIAVTTFDLKWRRDYQPQSDGSCRLVSALPFLTITYKLPKPSGRLPAPLDGSWKTFITGLRAHEKEHGRFIREMTQQTLDETVGLTVAGDSGCRAIRKDVAARAMAASVRQRDRSRAFDKVEMSDGGNVHRLILALVNGQ